jgi:hypothetical protein
LKKDERYKKKQQKEIQKDCKAIKVLAYSSAIQRQKRLYE